MSSKSSRKKKMVSTEVVPESNLNTTEIDYKEQLDEVKSKLAMKESLLDEWISKKEVIQTERNDILTEYKNYKNSAMKEQDVLRTEITELKDCIEKLTLEHKNFKSSLNEQLKLCQKELENSLALYEEQSALLVESRAENDILSFHSKELKDELESIKINQQEKVTTTSSERDEWKKKYEEVKSDFDSRMTQLQLSQQREQLLETEIMEYINTSKSSEKRCIIS